MYVLLLLFDTAMITTSWGANWASNMTSATPLKDDVTMHVTTTAASTTFPPGSGQTLQDDTVVTGTPVPDYTVNWLDIVNRKIASRKKHRVPKQVQLFKSQAHPGLVYTSAALVISVGLLGNGLLLLLAFQEDIRSHSYSVYLAALSVGDSAGVLNFFIAMILRLNNINSFAGESLDACRLKIFLMRFLLTLSPWILVAFSTDRYIAFVHPLKRRALCTVRNARVSCGVICLVMIVVHACTVSRVSWVRYGKETMCATNERTTYLLKLVEHLVNSVGASAVLLVLNVRILVNIIAGIRKRRQMAPGEGGQEEDTVRKMSTALLSIPLFSLLSTTPYTFSAAYIAVSTYYMTPMEEKHDGFERSLLELVPYMQVIFAMGFAGNFWMLLITSSSYRSMTRKMLKAKIKSAPTTHSPLPPPS